MPSSLLQQNLGTGLPVRGWGKTMTAKLDQFLELLEATDTPDDLQTLVETLRHVYDVEHAVYHAVDIGGSPYAAVTYDPAWGDRYHERGYVKIDPVVRGSIQQFHPVDWKRLDWSAKAARNFFSEAQESGVGNQGYTIPIRGPDGQFAIFTINQTSGDDQWNTFTRENARDFLLISHHIHHRVTKLLKADQMREQVELSPRERDALSFLGSGLPRSRVAEALRISEHTLRVYVDSARHKLGALNTLHAVAVAIQRGVIHV